MSEKKTEKVVLLGAVESGKTSLVERFLNEWWKADCTTTIGTAFGAKNVTVKGRVVKLGIWDTAGQERFEVMTKLYYRDAKTAIVCFDLTNPDSFKKVKFWVNELKGNAPDCTIFIVGTKLDLVEGPSASHSRGVSNDDISVFAANANAKFLETSAKTGDGTSELLTAVAEDILRRGATSVPVSNANNVNITQGYDKKQQQAGGFWSWC